MRKSKFTEEQIASIVTQAQAGVPIDELCRKYGISVQTFYRWRSKFAGLTPSELRRMKELEEENRRLKRVVADLTLDKQILQDVLRKKD
jgi:putative transposase